MFVEQVTTWFIYAFCLVLGLLLGSFINVVVYRLPLGESLVRPRSHCVSCNRQLGFHENIPLLSWALQKGRCRGCGVHISLRYPITEASVALAFVYSLWLIGLHLILLYVLIGGCTAIAASEIDLQIRRIPNRLIVWTLMVCLALLAMQVVVFGQFELVQRFVVAMLLGGLSLYVIAILSRGGIGMGDVKLVGLLGGIIGLLGFKYLFLMLLSAFALGSIYGVALIVAKRASRKSSVPFGPFIGGGFFLSQLAYHFIPHALLL